MNTYEYLFTLPKSKHFLRYYSIQIARHILVLWFECDVENLKKILKHYN